MPTYAYRCVNSNGIPEFERRGDHLYAAGGHEPIATFDGNKIFVGYGTTGIADAILGDDGRVHAGPSEGMVIFGVEGNEVRA